MFYGQQPQFGTPNFGVPGMVPGMGAPQPNMMGAMGYGATPTGAVLQYDPGLTDTVIKHIQVMLQQQQTPPQIAQALIANVSFQSGQPQVVQNANKMMMQTMRNLQQMGVDMSGRTPVRDEAIQQALRPWLNNSLAILSNSFQQAQQQQMMAGGGWNQPQMFGQPQMGMGYQTPQQGLYNVQPQNFQTPYSQPQQQQPQAQQNGIYNTGVKPTAQPNFIGTPNNSQQPNFQSPTVGAPIPLAPNQSAVPTVAVQQTPPPMLFDFTADHDGEVQEQLFSVGYTLLNKEVHKCVVGEVEAIATAVESGFTANNDDEALSFFADNAPTSLYDEGEFMHALHYKQVKALPVATDIFIKFRDKFISAPKKNWSTLLEILDDTPRGVSLAIDKFLTDMFNQALYSRFRVETNILAKIDIDSVFDIKELSEGKFGGVLKDFPEWHERIDDILNRVIDQVFTQADYISSEETDLSDVVRCDNINVAIGKLTKYNLGFASKDAQDALKTAIFAEYTILRFNRVIGVTNTLSEQDLQVDDLTPGNNTPGEILYWTMVDTLVKSHRKPFDAMIFVRSNDLQKEAVIESRNRIFAMDVKKDHYLRTAF